MAACDWLVARARCWRCHRSAHVCVPRLRYAGAFARSKLLFLHVNGDGASALKRGRLNTKKGLAKVQRARGLALWALVACGRDWRVGDSTGDRFRLCVGLSGAVGRHGRGSDHL